ncbi:ABC transporter permease [Curtobacterium ammoniigenes]|uniref:ABC transporter permease n=1 Tax=Curtobacterium ammoniigenes TaxID=395387 RepID=UPI00082A5320|nr:ABC transporter permease [Curtobacterium ammoniigenes]
MTAETSASTRRSQGPSSLPPSSRLSFAALVRSEWIKLRSIRSTVWCYLILIALTLGLAVLVGSVTNRGGAAMPLRDANMTFVIANTASVSLTALVVGVLGVLIITGEYGTGQIRSTFVADPRRIGALLAKAAVLAAVTFVVSIIATWIGVAASAGLLAGNNVHAHLADSAVFLPIVGVSVYVALLSLLAFGIGLLVRSSAGGIAITLGIILVLPVIMTVLASLTHAQWVADVTQFLPTEAGHQLYAYSGATSSGPGVHLNGWTGFAVLAGEVLVVGAAAIAIARRRDV